MSKIIYICYRDSSQPLYFPNDIELLSTRLTPDNISPLPPLILEGKGILAGIFNPVDSLPIKDLSICLGVFIGAKDDWWEPGAEAPDGSYALFRNNETTVELLSDIVASRTIWYVQTEDIFIASTSQRAIVFFLQDYEPNRAVYPWMLSSGTLGPGLSWDSRIRCLEGNARLILDRSSWKMTVARKPAVFSPLHLSEKEHEERLQKAIEDTFKHLHLDFSKWVLPLSGGFDSRGILLSLKDREGLKAITWGLKSALYDKNSDAYVTKSLANYFSLQHEYYETDISEEPTENIFDRFLVAGEGRIDHISGYMDGFKIWKQLFEGPYQGIIRGDEAFGCHAVRNPWEVYRNMSLSVMSDFANLAPAIKTLGDYDQEIPHGLQKRDNESIEMWRDRVNSEFEAPVVFAALNDLKLSFVEVINPLLSRRIVEQVRGLTDDLRTDKKLFRKIVKALSPDIKFAKKLAIANKRDILKTQGAVSVISRHLDTTRARELISQELVDYVLATLKVGGKDKSNYLIRGIRKSVDRIKRRIRRNNSVQIMDPNVFAFRACIISRMSEILAADAKALIDKAET